MGAAASCESEALSTQAYLRLCAAAAAVGTMKRRRMTMMDPPRWQRWNIPLSPWTGDTPVHLGPLIDFPWRTLQAGQDKGQGQGHGW